MMQRRRGIVPQVQKPTLTVKDAAEKLSQLADTVSRLTAVIAEETRLVRLGAYTAAAALEPTKGELSGRYMLEVDALNANADAIAAQPRSAVAEIEDLHVAFRSALDENLAVLGTARSVAESLMRGVAEEVAGRRAPKTYDARGGSYDQRATVAPITLSRGA